MWSAARYKHNLVVTRGRCRARDNFTLYLGGLGNGLAKVQGYSMSDEATTHAHRQTTLTPRAERTHFTPQNNQPRHLCYLINKMTTELV